MKDKLIELIEAGRGCPDDRAPFLDEHCLGCRYYDDKNCDIVRLADYLIAHGVTVQTTPISYERLWELALKMHCWIFLHCADEEKVYDQLGIPEEENYVFGYGGKIEVSLTEAPKEETK